MKMPHEIFVDKDYTATQNNTFSLKDKEHRERYVLQERNDVTEENYEASLEYAGEMAGEYLDEIGKSDLADLEPDQWRTLLDVIVRNQRQKMAELPPF